ncbi:adenine nucleotide alpha hydrolase family protein [Nonomuraea phyllanthi]|uniref:hypothetical protein n=1 Tax=Nonomuraea phyllanthi TaxID=2219224 RepID=UPI001D00888C|nr:hypothetical protein [Nonomuraea phyllanthi]
MQSTTLLLLSAHGKLPTIDVAVFADTGWEPKAVYAHLDRLEREVAQPAGIPILRVRAGWVEGNVPASTPARITGNLRTDSLTPGAFVRLPVFVRDRAGNGAAMVRRQCTEEYKIKPIKAAIRALLGYPHPRPVPAEVFADQWVGISRDEFHRAKDAHVRYLRNTFPLLDMDGAADGRPGWTRTDCQRYLRSHGWADTPKSACIGCPFHGNRQWRELRDNHPDEWADAVAFDRSLREMALRGIKERPYLHRSLLPLDQAPINKVTRTEWKQRQTDLFEALADDATTSATDDAEDGAPAGCSPWSCRGDQITDEAA